MKKITEKHKEEIIFLKDWCNIIYSFYVEIGVSDFEDWIITDAEMNEHPQLLRGLKETFVDTNDLTLDLSKEEFTELNRRLKERFGKTLYDFQKNTDKKIAQIIKRRKIRNEEEFRLAQMHIDRIFQDTEKEEEWKILEDLCFEFEQSVEVS